MSDLNPVIANGIGSPRGWLFTNNGEPLRDFDEQIIAKYLTKLTYTYNEEEDDECTLVFKFPTLRSFDLPYFQQDVILNIEWGYITTDAQIIKSPRRKIAIRDLETDYKKDGIELTLKCTDLVSYIKGMKTQRINQYRTEQTGGDPVTRANQQGGKALEDLFYKDVIYGTGINIIEKKGNKTTVVNTKGEVKTGIKNPSTGKYKPERKKPVSTMGFEWGNGKTPKIENMSLRNLGNRTYDRALATKLYWQTKTENLGNEGSMKKLNNSDGPAILDGTDNNLEVKTRNFNQPIFKAFTYYGGTGELLSFKSNTETRKNREHKSVASGVDPYSKKIISHTIDTVDTKPLAGQQTIRKATQSEIAKGLSQAKPSGKYSPELLQEVFDNEKKAYQDSYNQLDPNIKSKKVYTTVDKTYYNNITPYMGYKPAKEVVKKYTRAEIIASPEFKDFAEKHRNPELKGVTGSGSGLKKILTGYSIESIQRKYTATAETIGDPSLIKGKVYQFNNLGRLDRGKWYATSVQHTIDIEGGYTCEMTLMKNPKAIGISAKTYSSNPKYDKITDEITIDEEYDIKEGVIYDVEDEENDTNLGNMDNVEQETLAREADPIASMNDRLDYLNAEDDSLRDLTYSDEFLITQENEFINKPKPNAFKT